MSSPLNFDLMFLYCLVGIYWMLRHWFREIMGWMHQSIWYFLQQSLSAFSLSLCLFLSMSIDVTFIKLFDMQMTKSAYLKTTRGQVSTRARVVCFDFLNYDSDDEIMILWVFVAGDLYHISKLFTELVISEQVLNKRTAYYVGRKKNLFSFVLKVNRVIYYDYINNNRSWTDTNSCLCWCGFRLNKTFSAIAFNLKSILHAYCDPLLIIPQLKASDNRSNYFKMEMTFLAFFSVWEWVALLRSGVIKNYTAVKGLFSLAVKEKYPVSQLCWKCK